MRLDLKPNEGISDLAGNIIMGGFTEGQVYSIIPITTTSGFSSVIPLAPLNLSHSTKDKTQAKVWTYADQWWCVLPVTEGTSIFRLDGTSCKCFIPK